MSDHDHVEAGQKLKMKAKISKTRMCNNGIAKLEHGMLVNDAYEDMKFAEGSDGRKNRRKSMQHL